MSKPRIPQNSFGQALRSVRKLKGLSQEDFAPTSGRTYISEIERGQKNPTLDKIDAFAGVLGMHPLTLMALAYAKEASPEDARSLVRLVLGELDQLKALRA